MLYSVDVVGRLVVVLRLSRCGEMILLIGFG